MDAEQAEPRPLEALFDQWVGRTEMQARRIAELERQVAALTRQLVERDTEEESGARDREPFQTETGMELRVEFTSSEVQQLYLNSGDSGVDALGTAAIRKFVGRSGRALTRYIRFERNPGIDFDYTVTARLVVGSP